MHPMATQKRPTDDAVKKATGKNWQAWFTLLDKKKAGTMTHTEIARMLREKKLITKPWWSQMVSNIYEKERGKRVTGETLDAGFQVDVTKTIPSAAKDVWDLLTSPKGTGVWLGEELPLTLEPGATYATAKGITGEVRTVSPGTRLRLTWQPKGPSTQTTLQITVTPRKSTHGTCIGFHQEKLKSSKQREMMRRHWQGALDRLGNILRPAKQP